MRLKENFSEQKKTFGQLLSGIEINSVSIEPYCKRYLTYLLSHKEYFLEIYADVLEKVLAHTPKQKEEIILVDFGAGNGILGLFAKYCGFKKVYINDIELKFIAASKELSFHLKISVDGFIPGDATSLIEYFFDEKPQVIIGTDVIEHIYDLPEFFNILRRLNPDMVSVFTTASNPNNYIKIRQLQRIQIKDEFIGGTPTDSVLFGETAHDAYLKIRMDIIRQNFNLKEETIKTLAIATRGLILKDILTTVQNSLKTGKMPFQINHPTNTCNPLTGSWTERILTINEYISIYNASGFKLNLYEGFYDEHKRGGKKVMNILLNTAVRIFGNTLAPYLILAGSKK